MVWKHVRINLVAYLALFVALTGSASAVGVAARKAPKNSVTSKSIKDHQVRSVDLATGSVTGANLAPGAVPSVDPGTLSAGGVLTGTLGNAGIAGRAITRDQVTTTPGKVLNGANIDESTLVGVNAAQLGGRTSGEFVEGSANVFSGQVVTSTTPADTVLMKVQARFTLEATGVIHNFKLCGGLGIDLPQPVIYLNGPSATYHQATIPAFGCTPSLSTGGSGTGVGGTAGMMQIFAAGTTIFLTPFTQNDFTVRAEQYAILALGGLVEAD